MARVTAVIEGGEELMAKLQQLGLNVSQALEVAAHAGAAVIVQGANEGAPAPLIMAQTKERTKNRVSVDVGPPEEKWYWRFLEKGAQPHEIKGTPYVAFKGDEGLVITGSVNHPGTGARPFMRPAFDSRSGDATEAVGAHLRGVIEK
jgi:HK97 gp10 family phage protein